MRSRSQSARRTRALGALVVAALLINAASAGAATGKWAISSIANPGGTNQSFLDGVSCRTVRTVTTCIAVGSFVSSNGDVLPLIERWNGKRWSVSKGPVKKGAIASALVGISCASPSSCIAVGSMRAGVKTPTMPLAERWNGKTWKVLATRAPSGATQSYLNGVSCTGTKSCYAVGGFTSATTGGSTLVERWNGSTWSIMGAPNPGNASSAKLSGVSCTGAGAAATCAAVGSFATRPVGNPYYAVALRMTRGKWSLQNTPKVGNDQSHSLTSVSCTGPKNCFAAGGRRTGAGAGLIEHWNGSKWTVASAANPPGAALSQLNGISCATRTNCVATGLFSMDNATHASLINRWNGRRWVIQRSPAPAHAAGSALSAASCTSAGRCFAVGTYLTPDFANPPSGFSARSS